MVWQIVKCTSLDGPDRITDSSCGRREDERERGMRPLHAIEQVEPVHALHVGFAHDRVDGSGVERLKSPLCIAHEFARMAIARKDPIESLPCRRVVVHNQQVCAHAAPFDTSA
jgi:hypothetical protein